ncbi:hypothetical protein FSP39_012876 [Pinctada imbricata]|uniref:Uncharacterized protein n=1 Tax=Pinctada imbricata TaxID=66713 RepID=A0AA88Y2E1_PINIB|nr:hypothetical protein FSP39_012876 [Pinctada imbricata]
MWKETSTKSFIFVSQLLLFLQDFSQKMISRVHEIEIEVDGLMNESKLTSVRLNNVFNDFIMLANTQFVENRVYDEDVSQDDVAKSGEQQEDKEKTREEREAELIPRVQEALKLGIDVIDKAFDQLDSHAADSDSEDDDTAYRVDPILEAKDPYLSRPLPLMIGEPKFMEDDNVGLMEVESEGEESDVGSISDSDEDVKKPASDSEESSEEVNIHQYFIYLRNNN